MDRAFSPLIYHLRTKTLAAGRGWDGSPPLVLGNGAFLASVPAAMRKCHVLSDPGLGPPNSERPSKNRPPNFYNTPTG